MSEEQRGFGLAKLRVPGSIQDYDTGATLMPGDPGYAEAMAQIDARIAGRVAASAEEEAFLDRIGKEIAIDPLLTGEDLKRLYQIAMRAESL